MSGTSLVATVAVAQLPLMAVSVGNLISNHRLASKVIEKVGDRTRVVAPPRDQQAPNRDAQGHLRDSRGRFASRSRTDNVREIA